MTIVGDRINAIEKLGEYLTDHLEDELLKWSASAINKNPWFTRTEVDRAIRAVLPWLTRTALSDWTAPYTFNSTGTHRVGLVLAGNIPLVGFHDYLSVLVSGHRAAIRISSHDDGILVHLHRKLGELTPALATQSVFVERLEGFDAVIATGSDNSSRYFEYYFGKYPHIIRKNRSSIAVLTGDEPLSELAALGTDVFSYYGLGCRNVSKLLVPEDYSFDSLLSAWRRWSAVIDHHKYCNNYDYQKSILIVNSIPFHDSRFVIVKESKGVASPVSVVHYEPYKSLDDLKSILLRDRDRIQCIASAKGWYTGSVPFGETQQPGLSDHADRVDTLAFLSKL